MLLRYYGHFLSETGYGRAARDLANALHRHSGWTIDCRSLEGNRPTTGDATGTPDAVLVHTLPGDCARVLEMEGLADRGVHRVPMVAYTTWEATCFFQKWTMPRQVGGWDGFKFDAVWMPDVHIANSAPAGVAAAFIPHTYDPAPARWAPRKERRMGWPGLGSGEAFRFYWMGAPTARKNPFGVMSAFCAQFGGGSEPVALVFHSKIDPASWARFVATAAVDPRWIAEHVFISRGYLADDDVPAFHKGHDVFVTASRGEAWNLPAFEAALLGNWVIASFGHGSDAYLHADTSSRVTPLGKEPAWLDAELTAMEDTGDGGTKRARVNVTGLQGLDPTIHHWDVPNVLGIGEAMRRAYLARSRPRFQDYSVFSYPEVAKTVVRALEDVLNAKG